MSEISNESIKKLSEAIDENNEIIADVNNMIKELKGVKDVNDEVYEKYKKTSDDLVEDLDGILEVIEACKQSSTVAEDDPTLKSFDSKKKMAKSNADKSKKQLMDALSKLEKLLIKSKETEGKNKKGILKIGSKKKDDDPTLKKTEKDKSKDVDALSMKSEAGSSIVEDLEDIESINGKNINDINDEDNKDKSKNESGDNDSKSSKEKKKVDIIKKDSKKKDKSKKIDKSEKKDKVNDNQSEASLNVEDDKDNVEIEKDNDKKVDKTKKKDKNKDKSKDKNKKTGDVESIGSKNEDSFVEDVDNDEKKKVKSLSDSEGFIEDKKEASVDDKKKKKKKVMEKSSDTESIDIKEEHDEKNEKVKEKRSIFKKGKSKASADQDSLDDKKDSKDLDKKKQDKKDKKVEEIDNNVEDKNEKSKKKDKKKDKTLDDNKSLEEKNDKGKKNKKDKMSDDNKSLDEKNDKGKKNKKDKTSDDNKSLDEKNNKEKKEKKEKSLEIKENLNTSKGKDVESNIEMRTPSLRTQESLKSETDYDEDFYSEEENDETNVVVKKAVNVESRIPEDSNKPTTSLKRQQYVDTDEEKRTNKIEGELMASTTFENIGTFYVVIKAFKAESEDDLSGDIGEELSILEINDDGWWLAKNVDGDEGFVPIECLKPKQESKDLRDTQENDNISDNTIDPKDSKMLSEECSAHESKLIWDQIQQSMKKQSNERQKGLSDVLKDFGSLPTGFRFSTLAVWSKKNNVECSMKAHLCPKLSESDLSFKDLQCDTVENKIRPRSVRIQRTVQIVKALQMPVTSEKFVVKSRHIRICLFNGEKAISNIHIMRATVNEKDTRTWNFNSKAMDSSSSLDYNEMFFRSNHSSTDLSILLEFCMLGFKSKYVSTGEEVDTTQKKNNGVKIIEEFNDDELVEFSIGWTKIPLYEENGQLITNKNGDYELFGGTPYEVALEVDPNIGRTASGGKFKSLLSQNKQPQVTVRLSLPSRDHKELIETLPDIMIGSILHLTNLSYYRRILSEELINRRQNITSAEPIYSPFLVSFIEISDHSNMLDIMRTIWIEKMKAMKNADKKDYGKMNKAFKDAFLEYMYPLSKLKSLQPFNLARQDIEQMRATKIKEFIQRVKTDKLSVLLSGDYTYTPLSFEELSYKVVSKYSRAIKI